MRTKPLIVITHMIPEAGIELLKKKKYNVKVSRKQSALSRIELKKFVRGADAVLALLTDAIDAEILDAAGENLKIVANYAVGYDNIKLEDAKTRNVIVTNTPDVLSCAV
ncbi:MAG TPA: D-glycerate dehydrogenase, partial [Patescibacteria group bacterium]|nr:D-glycerate dehydrogenase [Patescibacteria group bacterium]